MADFGCGKGLDLEFWANMHTWTEDGDPGPKLNFNCVGFDLNAEKNTPSRKNIKYKNHDFNTQVCLIIHLIKIQHIRVLIQVQPKRNLE